MGKCCCLVFVFIVAMVVLGAKDVDSISVDAVCRATSYPVTCKHTLVAGGIFDVTVDYSSSLVTRLSLQSAHTGVSRTWDQVLFLHGTSPGIAVDICAETLGLSKERIQAAMMELHATTSRSQEAMDNVKAWVSAAMELHMTCIDAVLEVMGNAQRKQVVVQELVQQAIHTDQLFSNSLAFVNAKAEFGDDVTTWKNTAFMSYLGNDQLPDDLIGNVHIPGFGGNRRLLSSKATGGSLMISESSDSELPSWMDAQTERHLLQSNANNSGVVVAKDGSGNYKTIQAAVDAHQVNTVRLVIYVKAGTYNEQVNVPQTCKFLTITGDGDATIITGNKNVALMPGMTTFNSGTMIVSGEGFIGRWFLVQNTAGAAGHQAVAFRGSADKIALYRVTFDGYQDTLYAHTFRQFYRECTVRGTVDFIFGNAAASFQSCKLVAKKTTLVVQQNAYCAQGRTDPHQSTGMAFHNCVFDAAPDLKQAVASNSQLYKTYLGRPWQAYSLCVVMKSELMGHIDPAGWVPWNSSTFGLYTSYLAEYHNFGAGASTTSRVNWSRQISAASSANNYIANNFVQAGDWVISYNIPLTTTL